MCPGFWVHIICGLSFLLAIKITSKLSNFILHQFGGLHKLWDTPNVLLLFLLEMLQKYKLLPRVIILTLLLKLAKQLSRLFSCYISPLPISLNNKFHELTTLSKNSLQDSPLYLFLPPELLSEKPTEVPSNSPEERILKIGSLTVACLTSNN